jgi:hypothetical protein
MRQVLVDLIWKSLPDDLIDHLLLFLKPSLKMTLNKEYYKKYHYLVKQLIPIKYYESYLRDMVRNDSSFVFSYILNENIDKWLKWRNYRYKTLIYKNYIYFIKQFCLDNESHKCYAILQDELKKRGLSKKNIKIITNRDIRWTK